MKWINKKNKKSPNKPINNHIHNESPKKHKSCCILPGQVVFKLSIMTLHYQRCEVIKSRERGLTTPPLLIFWG